MNTTPRVANSTYRPENKLSTENELHNEFAVTGISQPHSNIVYGVLKRFSNDSTRSFPIFVADYRLRKDGNVVVIVTIGYRMPDESAEALVYHLVTLAGDKYEVVVSDTGLEELDEGYLNDEMRERDDVDAIEVGIFMCELAKWKGEWDMDEEA